MFQTLTIRFKLCFKQGWIFLNAIVIVWIIYGLRGREVSILFNSINPLLSVVCLNLVSKLLEICNFFCYFACANSSESEAILCNWSGFHVIMCKLICHHNKYGFNGVEFFGLLFAFCWKKQIVKCLRHPWRFVHRHLVDTLRWICATRMQHRQRIWNLLRLGWRCRRCFIHCLLRKCGHCTT